MAEIELKRLRAQRGLCKSTITRIENFISDPINVASSTIDTLEARKEKLISTLKSYESVHLDILNLDDKDIESVGVVEDKYFYVLGKINVALRQLKTRVDSERHSISTCKLPNIEISTFDGKDFAQFKPFIDLFNAVIDKNQSLSNVQKLFYLRKYLTADALAVIINLPLVNESYPEAIKLLEKRFDNETRIISNHINLLLDIPQMQKGTAASIRSFVSEVRQQLYALINLKQPVENWDMLLISILSRKLDSYTNRAYHLDRLSPDNLPTMEEFMNFLEKRAIALEDSSPQKSTCYEGSFNKSWQVLGAAALGPRRTKGRPRGSVHEYWRSRPQNTAQIGHLSIEVWLKTGRLHSDVLAEQKMTEGELRRPDSTIILWLKCEQNVLDARLDARVDAMLEAGLIEELMDFHERHNQHRIQEGIPPDYTKGVFQTLGFKEFHNYLMLSPSQRAEEGKQPLEWSIENMKTGTRRYARRQNKMVKARFLDHPTRQVPPIYELDTTDVSKWDDNVKNKAIHIIESFINNTNCDIEPIKSNLPVEKKYVDGNSYNHCDVCQRIFIGDNVYAIHLKSNRHMKVMKLKNKLKEQCMGQNNEETQKT